MEKKIARPDVRFAGLPVRSDLRAGRSVCYQEINGVWFPISDTGTITPPLPTPTPEPGVQWLSCNSCSGTQINPGQLAPANCEVCYL
jgi:hypothetical protein